mmetsp:Transcript_87313/g.174391  ORF Transcript_87313/g.174391 Transcript_87313/m.174391 type:complete len:220 (-) Transcript_87313:179-838(-)
MARHGRSSHVHVLRMHVHMQAALQPTAGRWPYSSCEARSLASSPWCAARVYAYALQGVGRGMRCACHVAASSGEVQVQVRTHKRVTSALIPCTPTAQPARARPLRPRQSFVIGGARGLCMCECEWRPRQCPATAMGVAAVAGCSAGQGRSQCAVPHAHHMPRRAAHDEHRMHAYAIMPLSCMWPSCGGVCGARTFPSSSPTIPILSPPCWAPIPMENHM